MQIRNTADGYGLVAVTLHWLIALLFLFSYVTIFAPELLGFESGAVRGPPAALSVHQAVGISIFVFAVIRLAWRFANTQPMEDPAPAWQHWAARAVHVLLYLGMFLMPLTGYLGTRGPTSFGLFQLPTFNSTAIYDTVVVGWMGMDWDSFEAPLDAFHHFVGGNLLWMLILLHVAAAIYHHMVMRDRTLMRMVYG
jgi:cytochrome b561